jgi:hypothetical protein
MRHGEVEIRMASAPRTVKVLSTREPRGSPHSNSTLVLSDHRSLFRAGRPILRMNYWLRLSLLRVASLAYGVCNTSEQSMSDLRRSPTGLQRSSCGKRGRNKEAAVSHMVRIPRAAMKCFVQNPPIGHFSVTCIARLLTALCVWLWNLLY